MKSRHQLWRKQIQKHPYAIGAVVGLVIILFIFLAYWFNWNWTGFNGADKTDKTLYDWLQLLFVPVALTGFGFFLNYREKKSEEQRIDKERQEEERRTENERKLEQQRAQTRHEIAKDNQCEEALQAYINEMSELLLHENLRKSEEDDEVRSIARVRTLTVLKRIDGLRKANVLQFLYESRLIDKDKPIIDLNGADFDGTILLKAKLRQANLESVSLIDADLTEGDFTEANLSHSLMMNAKLYNTILTSADLRFSDLTVADITRTYLQDALLTDAILSRAKIHWVKLNGADLSRADLSMSTISMVELSGADLSGADLSYANLKMQNMNEEQLAKVSSLKGTTMPDGSIHP